MVHATRKALLLIGILTACARTSHSNNDNDGSPPADSGKDASVIDEVTTGVDVPVGDSKGQGYESMIIAAEPIAYWRFDETSTPTAIDHSSNGHDGVYKLVTLGAPGAIAGDSNTAVELGPDNSAIEFGDKFGFEGQAPFTIELWMNPSEADGLVMGKVTFDGAWYDGWHISFNSGSIGFRRNRRNYNAEGLESGTYNHVCVTYDGINLRLYINGQRVSQALAEDQLPPVAADFVIGRMYPNQWKRYAGLLDEVALYDRALAPDEISEHYSAGAVP